MGAGVGEEDEGHVKHLFFSLSISFSFLGREGGGGASLALGRVLDVRRGTRSLFVSEVVRSVWRGFRWFKYAEMARMTGVLS